MNNDSYHWHNVQCKTSRQRFCKASKCVLKILLCNIIALHQKDSGSTIDRKHNWLIGPDIKRWTQVRFFLSAENTGDGTFHQGWEPANFLVAPAPDFFFSKGPKNTGFGSWLLVKFGKIFFSPQASKVKLQKI